MGYCFGAPVQSHVDRRSIGPGPPSCGDTGHPLTFIGAESALPAWRPMHTTCSGHGRVSPKRTKTPSSICARDGCAGGWCRSWCLAKEQSQPSTISGPWLSSCSRGSSSPCCMYSMAISVSAYLCARIGVRALPVSLTALSREKRRFSGQRNQGKSPSDEQQASSPHTAEHLCAFNDTPSDVHAPGVAPGFEEDDE